MESSSIATAWNSASNIAWGGSIFGGITPGFGIAGGAFFPSSLFFSSVVGSNIFGANTSAAFVQQVNRAVTVTAVTASSPNPGVNQAVVLTAYVTPVYPANGPQTGTVQFFANGASLGAGPVPVSNGIATLLAERIQTLVDEKRENS